MYRTLRTTELELIAVDNETAVSVLSSANTVFVPIGQGTNFELEVASTSTLWEKVNGRWQVRILQTMHNLKNITEIVAERLDDSGNYENMIYGYKKYLSGSIAIIVDEKIDIKIIIKGV